MSSGEKAAKGKGKAPLKTKSTKGKEASINDQRFRGDGVKFKCKLVGTADVERARGDSMCAEAIKKLKAQALKSHKESGEHKQKIVMYVTLKGIRIVDEKSQKVQHDHPINKISFITHDPEDKRIFGYVCSQACTTGHKLYAIKSEKPAGTVTGTLYELFQIVFKIRQEAGLSKKVQKAPQVPNNSAQVSNGPQPSSPENSDGIYEVPYKNGNKNQAKPSPQLDHEYAEPMKPSARKDPHYKVPTSPPLPLTPSSQNMENNRGDVEEKEKTSSADSSNTSTLLNQSQSFEKEPDQVSRTSVPDSPFPNHDNNADMSFFGSSVFDTAPSESGMADTVSVASSADVSMLRTGSVSSASSETRSTHSCSGSLVNQTATTEGVQPGFTTTFNDTSDDQTQNSGDFPVSFPLQPGYEEKSEENKKVELSTVQDTLASNPDPFASSTDDNERTKPVAGEGFFTESFATFDTAFGDFEVKSSDGDNQAKEDLPSTDPFAPSVGTQDRGGVTENAEGFASETSFDAAFSSEPFTPSQHNTDASPDDKQDAADEEPFEVKSQFVVKSDASFTWGNAFGETENESKPDVTQNAGSFSWENAFEDTKNESKPDATQNGTLSQVQLAWAESFASDDVDIKAKTDSSKAVSSVCWDDAFGGVPATDKESSDQVLDAFTWDDAFGGKTADGNNSQFDTPPFDAFTSSKKESAGDKPSAAEDNVESVPRLTVPDNPSQFDDLVFANPLSSEFSESSAGVNLASGEHKELPLSSKDPFEEFKISFPPPDTDPVKIASDEAANSSEAEISTPDEDSAGAKKIVSNDVPSDENVKETVNMENTDETLNQAKDEVPVSIIGNNSDEEEEEQMNAKRPSELQMFEPTLLSQRPISPTAPPPLPPRPVVSAPPLPARPTSSSSTVSTEMSPMGQRLSTGSPTSNSPRQGKKGSAKKAPPPLPPRVDLNERLGEDFSNKNGTLPDPFGSDLFDNQFGDSKAVIGQDNSDWTASWPSAPELPPKEKSKDPFSDNFFTDFDFPQKPANSKAINDNPDPFATQNPSLEPFPMTFGNEDLFAAFTPAKVETAFGSEDPFHNDMSHSFVAFSSEDPFGDISDPFADKGILGEDPFGDSPSKLQMGDSLTLNESLVASDDADSFA